MAQIVIEGLAKDFPGGVRAVDDVSIAIADGEFTVLVGPSGSGKSTVLRMVGGLEAPTAGTIRIGDRVVNDLPPKARDIAMVFQDYALYPQMTAYRNMEFGLRMRNVPSDTRARLVRRAAALLGIEDLLERRPAQMSGGQRQRVAMGRALVREPQAFLMDEPLSNLDAKLRVQMRSEIVRLHQRLGTTTLFVTHDQTEAMTMGERIVVMRDGQAVQVATPKDLYDDPVDLFVGTFIGSPPMNVVSAKLVREGDGCVACFGCHSLDVPDVHFERRSGLRAYVGRDVLLGIRPESIDDYALLQRNDPGTRLDVDVALLEQLGAEVVAHFKLDAPANAVDAIAQARELDAASDGADVDSEINSMMVARLDPRTQATVDAPISLRVDVNRLYFFDPTTEVAIA
jgi:multiple sugar transport system ATP-binding protein